MFTPARPTAVLAVLTASLLLGACASTSGDSPLTSNLSKVSADAEKGSAPKSELQKATDYWGKAHAASPSDPAAALNYARNLKALGAKKEALVILQEAHRTNPTDKSINSEYGRLALEHDQFSTAEKLLEHADDATQPDWRVVSARGTVLAKQGKHPESIPFFERALSIAPEQASIMNNLAMAHAMNGHPDKAETLLRQAAAKNKNDPRIQQNLALVLGLQGKHDEARLTNAGGPATDDSTHNADMMRQMVGSTTPPAEPVSMSSVAPLRAQPAVASSVQTGSTNKARGKGKPNDASTAKDIDAAELVRRLADGAAPTPR
jgi:Flp pilus assembly protein TadD